MVSVVTKKLNIIYRLCENEMDGRLRDIRPYWFSKDKCLKSFLNAVEFDEKNIESVIFVHDGEGDKLLNLIPKRYNIVKINYKSNLLSLKETLKIADQVGGNIYFVEDDYLHLIESISKINLALSKYKLLTGYEHSQRYINCDDINYEKKIDFDLSSNHHWRTSESTCCTYAIEEDTYKNQKETIKSFSLNDRGLFRHFHSINIPLWTPIPALTTQVDPYMSLGIDWQKFNETIT